ncbi:hypothetical protein B0H16DRAFT_1665936 [Mycena metata]|uniref:Uncharacterized protein n=1 Tax=Mycena metata TaxID=1033252 RepID=A0AAD7MN40_9AGAR|nr:hypothetical protein B0H16DRAFT_1665936 [Mycena metata]
MLLSNEEKERRAKTMQESYHRYLAYGIPDQKPTWTFPSPFFPYAVAPHAREEICWGPQPRTLAELRMYALSWAIRSKPEWQRKISDAIILDKWRTEALAQQHALRIEEKLTPNMVNYVLTELAGYARLSDPTTGIESGPFDAIWFSDRLISLEVSERLRAVVSQVENTPNVPKDWHPGSNGQVLDLVHPSLYCIVYDRTQNLDSTSPKLEPPEYIPPTAQLRSDWSYDLQAKPVSDKFCWLPSDFSVDATDGSVKLTSPYINNLHPTKHKALYPIIESVLGAFIPLFERVLSQVNGQDQDLYRDVTPGSGRIVTKLSYGYWAGYNKKPCGITVPCIWSNAEVEVPDDTTDEEYYRLQEAAPKVLPEAFEEYTGELEKTIVPYSLRGKTIQCIIKLASIHLTPENAEYDGGSWHVEGMLNEHIVASGIYYYEEENISESRLAFRMTTGAPVYHIQEDVVCSRILYGMERNHHPCQNLGSIATSANRALAWPNIYQHRVSPFRLVDPTQPGHRKILAIFLVDPSIPRIPSATDIPPQQLHWMFDTLEELRADLGSLFSRLPVELLVLITGFLPETYVTREEADEYRLELMGERKNFFSLREEDYQYTFDMCEH